MIRRWHYSYMSIGPVDVYEVKFSQRHFLTLLKATDWNPLYNRSFSAAVQLWYRDKFKPFDDDTRALRAHLSHLSQIIEALKIDLIPLLWSSSIKETMNLVENMVNLKYFSVLKLWWRSQYCVTRQNFFQNVKKSVCFIFSWLWTTTVTVVTQHWNLARPQITANTA